MSTEFFTISEINRFIKDVIDSGFPQALWVCGEIQGYDRNKHKNHIYFELVEKEPASKNVSAKINAVIFANNKYSIQNVLKRAENAFELKDDIEVKFLVRVNFYAPYGTMSLIVEDIDPAYTLGKLAQERQRLIALLKEKGTLDQNKKAELTPVPLHIGLITADNSAAYNDFVSELKKSGFRFRLYLRNCLMQGKAAEKDVSQAVRELNQLKSLDVIVITRGGGSLAELGCFDSQLIAESVAASRLPVLSGIGHEINLTVTDMAAHTYAKTPTAIARFIVEKVTSFVEQVDKLADRLFVATEGKMEREKLLLRDVALDLQNHTIHFLKRHNEKIIRLTEFIGSRPAQILKDRKKAVVLQGPKLAKAAVSRIYHDRQKLKSFEKIVGVLHPRNTLKRGFSITRSRTGRSLKSVEDSQGEEDLITELFDGSIESRIYKRKKGDGIGRDKIQQVH